MAWPSIFIGGLALLVPWTAGATGPTTITFAEHPAGTTIDSEYAAQGVRFGKASELGVSLAGARDCGAPTVAEGTDGRYAVTPSCGGSSGTVAAFAFPRRTISLRVAALRSGSELHAFGRSGTLLEKLTRPAGATTVTLERPTPDIAFVALQSAGEGGAGIAFDDLQFDHLGDPLTVAPRGVGATVGAERTDNVARLTDADPTATVADYRVTIEWGDGQSSSGRLVASGDGYDVVGTHTYAAAGTFTIRTTVEKANGVRATATSSARVVDRPDFAVAVSPGSTSVAQGVGGRFTVSVTPLAGFTGRVSLSLAGASGAFAPASVSVPGSAQLTVTTSASTAPGSYPLTITATSGSLTRSATATLTVTKAAPSVVARLAGPRTAPALALVALDARGTTGATRYLWDVSGDRLPDVACGAKTPVLGVRLRTPGRRTVSVTAVGANGSTSVQRRTLGIRKRPGADRRFTEVAACLRDARPYLEGRACAEKVVFGVVEATGCFVAQGGSLVARGTVKLNGVSFLPSGGASIVLDPQLERIGSASAAVSLGPIRVRDAKPFSLPLSGAVPPPAKGRTLGKRRYPRVKLFTFVAATPLPQLGGFRLRGDAELSLVRKGARHLSETKVTLELPGRFSFFGGSPPTGATRLEADNERGLVLDEVHVSVPEAHLGAIRMTNLSFEFKAKGNPEFNCHRRWWKATANVFLGSTGTDGGFRLAPGPRRNGVAFCDGTFKAAGGEIVFEPPLPEPQLFPGIFLRTIGFELELDPTVVVGTGKISAARLTEVNGSLLMAFPSWNAPYVVKPEEAKGHLAQLVGRVFVTPTIAVGGDFGFTVPGLGERIDFSRGYFVYAYPDFVAVGGSVRVPAPGMSFTAGMTGEVSVSRALFSFHGFVDACLAGLACFVRADAWVTSTGVVVCGNILGGRLHPGAGLRWGDVWPTIWLVDGCKPSHYWPNLRPNALSLGPFGAAAATSFTVARGERAKNVRLDGVGGAPRIEVRGPGGEVVSTIGGDFATGPTIRLLRQDQGKVTWIGVENGRPGTYTVTTLPGSVGLAGIAATRPTDEHLRVSVTGRGSNRALRYDVARVPGRRVTFFERGRSSYVRIGSVTGGKGLLRFAPAAGTSGLRQIVARIELDGTPTPERVVARYRLAPPPRLVRPGSLRVRRTGSVVTAAWTRVPGAARYAVVLGLRNGLQRLRYVPPGRTSVRLAGIPATQSGVLAVRALGSLGERGRAAAGRFAAPKRAPSAFRPYSELRRRR